MPKGKERAVNVYDFKSLSEGKAVPYGVYDLNHLQLYTSHAANHP